jgi:hypothetical protein
MQLSHRYVATVPTRPRFPAGLFIAIALVSIYHQGLSHCYPADQSCGLLHWQMGLLAGGLADGSVCLWDPAVILGQHSAGGRSPLLAKMQKHTGAVRHLDIRVRS